MNMRTETVDEFLKRGGTVTKIPEVLDTIGSWWGYQERYQTESPKEGTQQVVSWESIQPDKRFDTDDDDRKYWNKLDRRCDKLLKKLGEKSKPNMTEESPLWNVPKHSEKGTPGRPYGIAGGKHHRVGKK